MTAVTGAASAAATTEGKPEGLLINLREAAGLLGVSERRVQYLVQLDALPSLKLGKSRRFKPEDLRAWVAAGAPTRPGAADLVREGGAH